MTIEERKDNIYYDQTGKQILVGDLLKVYHFTLGKRKQYMYQVVVMDESTECFPVMAFRDYKNLDPHCRMYVVCNNSQRVHFRAKIISIKDWQTKRNKIKVNL